MSPRINARVVSPPQPVGGLAGLGSPGAHIIFTPLGLLPESLEVDPRPDFFVCLFSRRLVHKWLRWRGPPPAGGGLREKVPINNN